MRSGITRKLAIPQAPPLRLGVWGVVVAAHIAILWALSLSTSISRASPTQTWITAALIQSNNPARRSAELMPLVRQALVMEDPTEPVSGLPAPPIIEIVEPNTAAVSVAPQLLDTAPPNMASYARQAGLLPGESAMVVLRVEVLADGQVGEVQVDVSSGSRQVDEAAMAYVRRQTWVPGRAQGMEEPTWVRCGVRLAA